MVAQNLVVTWEDVYRKYESAVGSDVTKTSRAVAEAWRELATCVELPWWLSAAVRSAAQAFELQAEAWTGGDAGQDDMTEAHTDDEEEDDEYVTHGTVVLPTQQGNQTLCACADAPPDDERQAPAVRAVRAMA